jgi:hypothetical protein
LFLEILKATMPERRRLKRPGAAWQWHAAFPRILTFSRSEDVRLQWYGSVAARLRILA